MNRRHVARLLPALLAFVAACPADPGSDVPADLPADLPSNGVLPSDDTADIPCPTVLDWVTPAEGFGSGFDDALPFTGCPRAIQVKASACGVPVAGLALSSSISGRPEGACLLDTPDVSTGADGTATLILRGLPNDDLGGECVLTACAGPDACLDASLHWNCSAYPRLVVAFGVPPALDGVATLGKVWLYLPDASGRPACADLDPSALPDPADRKGPVSILTTIQFPLVQGLEKAGDLVPVTVVAQASNGADGPLLGTGCVEAVTDFCVRTFLEIPLAPLSTP